MKNRTLLGQILTVVIYLYNTAAVGLLVIMIAGLIGSNSIADKYGDTIPSLTGVNPLGAILSFLFVGVVWLVFYFILKKIRDAAGFIDNKNIASKENDKGSLIEYFSKRKKNTAMFIALGSIIKVLIHHFIYEGHHWKYGERIMRSSRHPKIIKIPAEWYETYTYDILETFSIMFSGGLWLFIPAFLSLGFIVWYFNDKIKAK